MVFIETFAWNSFKIMREVPMSDAFVIVLVILVTVVIVMEYLEIQGPLFFGSPGGFVELFDPQKNPATVVVDFAHSRVVDQSALQVIEVVAAKYDAEGKSLQLRHLSRDCHRFLNKAGQLMVGSDDDPDYGLAVNYSVRTGILGGH